MYELLAVNHNSGVKCNKNKSYKYSYENDK